MPDRGRRMSLQELASYYAVVGPFALGTLYGVAFGNPAWLAVGLVPAFVWGRWETRRRRFLRCDPQQVVHAVDDELHRQRRQIDGHDPGHHRASGHLQQPDQHLGTQ